MRTNYFGVLKRRILLEKIMKDSGYWYKEVIKANGENL